MPAVVVGDAQRLQQILLNILNNSVKFTEEGEILLEVWAEEELRPEAGTGGSALEGCAEEQQPQAAVGASGGVAGAASGSSSESQPGPSAGSAFAAAGAAAACNSGSKQEAARGEGRGLILHFSVRDTGIGISAENIGRLFQSFSQVWEGKLAWAVCHAAVAGASAFCTTPPPATSQTKHGCPLPKRNVSVPPPLLPCPQVDASPTRRHGGSGLGLAICQKLCQAMGGRMWAESGGVGSGSMFRWWIRVQLPDPRAPVAVSRASSGRLSLDIASARSSTDGGSTPLASLTPTPSAALQAAPYNLAGRRVLLVEPCPMVRQVLMLALRRWGCVVCAVATEAEGMARLQMAGAAAPGGTPLLRAAAAAAAGGSPAGRPPPAPEPAGAAGRRRSGEARGRRRRKHMQLEHAEEVGEAEYQVGCLASGWVVVARAPGGIWMHCPAGQVLQCAVTAAPALPVLRFLLCSASGSAWGDSCSARVASAFLYPAQAPGPFDLVILDLMHQSLLQALQLLAHPAEAQVGGSPTECTGGCKADSFLLDAQLRQPVCTLLKKVVLGCTLCNIRSLCWALTLSPKSLCLPPAASGVSGLAWAERP